MLLDGTARKISSELFLVNSFSTHLDKQDTNTLGRARVGPSTPPVGMLRTAIPCSGSFMSSEMFCSQVSYDSEARECEESQAERTSLCSSNGTILYGQTSWIFN